MHLQALKNLLHLFQSAVQHYYLEARFGRQIKRLLGRFEQLPMAPQTAQHPLKILAGRFTFVQNQHA